MKRKPKEDPERVAYTYPAIQGNTCARIIEHGTNPPVWRTCEKCCSGHSIVGPDNG